MSLAAQIEQGVKPDVFAAANTKLPDALYAKGLIEKPVVFTANQLVLAVPATSTKVTGFADLQKPGVTISVGTADRAGGRVHAHGSREASARPGRRQSRRTSGTGNPT